MDVYLTYIMELLKFIHSKLNKMEWISNDDTDDRLPDLPEHYDYLKELSDEEWRFSLYWMLSNRTGGKKPGLE